MVDCHCRNTVLLGVKWSQFFKHFQICPDSRYLVFTTNASVSRSIKNTPPKEVLLKPQSQPPSSLGLCGQPFFPLTYTHINKALMFFLLKAPLVSFQPCGDVRLHLAPQNLAKRPGLGSKEATQRKGHGHGFQFWGRVFSNQKNCWSRYSVYM